MFNYKQFKEAGRKRIKDRGILWKEDYGEKSIKVKERYQKSIGPGSYYKWEGHDYTTDSDYFIVVGPSVDKFGRKQWFAGIKKLPPKYKRKIGIYTPTGKYFTSIVSALGHARDMWGINFPKDQEPYTVQNLENVKVTKKLRG
jgi:hypothetical protein